MKKEYTTTDFNKALALVIGECKIARLNKEKFPYLFTFEDEDVCMDVLLKFSNGDLVASVKKVIYERDALTALIKN